MSDTKPTGQAQAIPQHVAIIMDGNGRWAKKRGLPRLAGHQAGTENLRRIIRACVELGVRYLTIYAFSTENWGRPREEVEGLLKILESVIEKELRELHEEGVQLRHIGRLEKLPASLRTQVKNAIELTKDNDRLTVVVAFNYGGKDEIVHAVEQLIRAGVKPEEVSESLIASQLFTAGIPDPELIIRTSGEMRLSNFLIWQAAYSEYYVTPAYWPDFDKEELQKAIDAYGLRNRRFGSVDDENYKD
ncbi:MAG: isoprenyl transferase [Anaerolinea sp.]|nr:isoprenyl transferase [Anaerolinea sp.]